MPEREGRPCEEPRHLRRVPHARSADVRQLARVQRAGPASTPGRRERRKRRSRARPRPTCLRTACISPEGRIGTSFPLSRAFGFAATRAPTRCTDALVQKDNGSGTSPEATDSSTWKAVAAWRQLAFAPVAASIVQRNPWRTPPQRWLSVRETGKEWRLPGRFPGAGHMSREPTSGRSRSSSRYRW